MDLSEETILEKANKGEKLTEKEETFIMGQIHEEDSLGDTGAEAEDKSETDEDFKDTEEIKPESEEQETTPEPEKKTEEKKEEVTDEKSEEPEKTSEPEKKADEVDLGKVMTELEKPDGEQDISDYSEREKGLYWAMKNERVKRQKLEDDYDALRFKHLKEETVNPEEEGSGDDIVTKAELKKMRDEDRRVQEQMLNKTIFGVWEREAKRTYSDFDDVAKIAEVLIQNNPAYQQEVLKAAQTGNNPALVMYELTKRDPSFEQRYSLAFPDKATKKKEETAKKQETAEKAQKLKSNQNKPTTTGAKGGTGDSTPEEEISLESIVSMPDEDFMKLPKAKREALLKKYGY